MNWFEQMGCLFGKPDEWWPQLIPETEFADFSYDATTDIAAGDSIVGLSLVVAPSGPGEAVMSRLVLATPTLVAVWVTGGVAGRDYLYKLTISTQQGRNLLIMIGQQCAPVLAQYPLTPPPNPGFGSQITWTV